MNSLLILADMRIFHLDCLCTSKDWSIVESRRVANTNIVTASDSAAIEDISPLNLCEARRRASSNSSRERLSSLILLLRRCRFEKEARLKKLAQSPKDKSEKTLQAIIIPMPISEEPKRRPSPIQISVQTTSTSSSQYRRKSPPPSSKRRASADDNYSEDFDGSDRDKAPAKTGYATDASSTRSIKVTPKRSTPPVQAPIKPASRKSSARSSARSPVPKQVEPSKKTWQLIFYPSDLPRGNVQFDDTDRSSRETNAKINVSLVGNGQETETYAIDLQPLIEDPRSTERRSVSIKLKEIGHPDGITVKIDTDERDGVKWHLDRVGRAARTRMKMSFFSI